MADALERLKILIDSSTPIVVMETVEEMHAVRLVRVACSSLNLAVFEWSIASGLARCGSDDRHLELESRFPASTYGSGVAQPGAGHDLTNLSAQALYNSRDPVQALGNLEGISIDAAFILKDFHRHMEDPVVVRRLRDVGQKFSQNRRTVILTAPSITMPPELASLVEFLELPLPDKQRLRQIIDEMIVRVGKTRTLKRTLDAAGLDAVANNLRGLTEEEAERAVSQAIVSRYGLTPEIVTDVLQAKKEMLRRSEMLEFVDVSDTLASVGGLEHLKSWLGQRRGTWEDQAREFGLEPPRGVIILGVQGCGKSMCARRLPVSGSCRWSNSIPPRYTISTSARLRNEFRKYFRWLRGWHLVSCGSTNWRKFLPGAGRIQRRRTRAFRRGCWHRFFPGCRTGRRRYLWRPRATM